MWTQLVKSMAIEQDTLEQPHMSLRSCQVSVVGCINPQYWAVEQWNCILWGDVSVLEEYKSIFSKKRLHSLAIILDVHVVVLQLQTVAHLLL